MNNQYTRIPALSFTGAGSQPADEDFAFLPVPATVSPLQTPPLPRDVSRQASEIAHQVLYWLSVVLGDYREHDTDYPVYVLNDEQQAQALVLDQIFGEGEVSAKVQYPAGQSAVLETLIQETVFAGVWRVRDYASGQRLLADRIEVCPVPCCVWQLRQSAHTAGNISLPDELPGMMNGRFIAHEVRARLQQTPVEPHVINLTLLPMNETDIRYLHQFLGEGDSAIFSRGYGKCRIISSQYPGVWRVNYFNDNNTLLQDMIEIGRIPDIVLAGNDDFSASKQRIDEVLLWLERDANSTSNLVSTRSTSVNTTRQSHATTLPDNVRMECKICWWVYDPALGDEVWQIPPGTPFRLLPDHWKCPCCDAEKSGFMLLTAASAR